MYTQLRLRVWLVEPRHEDTVDEGEGLPPDAEVLDERAFRERLEAGDRPDALLVDAGTLDRLDTQHFALDGVLRTVIVTNPATGDVRSGYLNRPSIRILHRPVDPGDLGRALLWLSGVEDDGWATEAAR